VSRIEEGGRFAAGSNGPGILHDICCGPVVAIRRRLLLSWLGQGALGIWQARVEKRIQNTKGAGLRANCCIPLRV